jgi:hypothetical protein
VLSTTYNYGDKSKRKRWARHVELTGKIRIAGKMFDKKTEWKRTLAIPTHRWDDNYVYYSRT